MLNEDDKKWRRKFFSSGPYIICPKCKQNSFGMPIMGIHGESYQKECFECGYSEKKVLLKIG